MDWIVFADDWGAHPTTTQHLILNMPAGDKIIWVDSIGMRSPRICIKDTRRIISKVRGFLERQDSKKAEGAVHGAFVAGAVGIE